MPDKFVNENRFVLGHVLSEILQIFTGHKYNFRMLETIKNRLDL